MKRLAIGRIAPALRGGAWFLVLLLGCASACGDDDAPVPNDAGDDAGGSGRAGTGGGIIGRRDAQVTRDPVPECDPTEPVACPAGQRCQAVVRRAPGEDQFTLTTGCVEDKGGRAKGAPCDPWGGGLAPYRAEGLEDELYVDPCDDGLFCAPNPEVRGSFSCQQGCPLGTCNSDDQQCVGANAIEAVCRAIDDCDPLSGSGCGTGMTCYLALDANGTRVLPSCQPTPETPKADGVACELIGDCLAGSSCWGPPRLPPARWTLETLLCRPTCNTMATAVDGDMDAGELAPGTCADGTMCRGLAASGLEVDLLAAGIGECE